MTATPDFAIERPARNHVSANTARAARPSSPVKRIYSITRAETLLFLRNPTILLTALLLPVTMVAILAPSLGSNMGGVVFSSFLVQTLAVWALLLIVYVNLTTIFVSRREEGVFQRMSTGEATPWEAMVAGSVPSVVVALVQVALGVVGSLLLVDGAGVVNPVLILLGMVGASVFLGGVAAWTSRYTTTVEGAQFSTMPVLMLLILTSGTLLPLSVLPDSVARLFEWTPFHAVSELISLGMSGTAEASMIGAETTTGAASSFIDTWSAAAPALVVMAVWAVGAVVLARRTMIFARRR